MKRRRSKMNDQKAVLGDQHGNSQRQVQPLRGKAEDRKDLKQGGRSVSFPREVSRSDRAGGYSYSRGHQSRSGSRHVFEQAKGAHWHSRERQQVGKSRNLDVVPALSGKKSGVVSLNHLLNFTFAPRDTSTLYRPKQSMSKSAVVYNKEQFLQANCQFVVQEKGDYTIHAADPDLVVEWSLVEQVRLLCHEMPSCPICLYSPKAAKITRCGHVYCWACMLHYLALSEKRWRKCPICYEAVHQEDLKSVVALSTQPFAVGDTVTMQLMERQKGSVAVVPQSQHALTDGCQPHNVEGGSTTQFRKLLTISPEQTLEKIIADEETQLQYQLTEIDEKKNDNPCFVEAALKLLEERKEALSAHQDISKEVDDSVRDIGGDSLKQIESAGQSHFPLWAGASSDQFQQVGEYEAAFSESEEGDSGDVVSCDIGPTSGEGEAGDGKDEDSSLVEAENDTIRLVEMDSWAKDVKPLEGSSPPSHTYYFYQSSDGQHLYLHPVNTKCLITTFGSMENCPDVIVGQIVEMEHMTQSEFMRKRYRFLSHLPLSCQFAVCELELKSPAVSTAALELHSDELLQRKQRRRKKAREEQRREKRLEAKNKTQSPLPSASQFLSQHQWLSVNGQRDGSLNPTAAVFVPNADSHQSIQNESQLDSEEFSPPSFAQALCGGMDKLSPPSWPMRRQSAPSLPQLEESASRELNPNDSDGEASNVPSFQDSFLEALSFSDVVESKSGSRSSHTSESKTQKSSKKGRTKQLLFTTGGQRRY